MARQGGWVATAAVALVASVGVTSYQGKPSPAPPAGQPAGQQTHADAGGSRGAGVPEAAAAAAAAAFRNGPCAEMEKRLQAFFITEARVAPPYCYGLPAHTGETGNAAETAAPAVPTEKSRHSATAAPAGDSGAAELLRDTAGLRFVIATVPDPVHTHFSLAFDRAAEALQQAAQDEGFLYDSSWLPWERKEPAFSALADQDKADTRKEVEEDQPGVLLFRGAGQPGDPANALYRKGLVLLLVGDEPTGGLHREQFLNALAWIDALQPRAAGPPAFPVQITGPSFSGSLPSLAALLATPAAQRVLTPPASYPHLEIFSGNVSSSRAVAGFLGATDAHSALSGLHVHFASSQTGDALAEERYCNYLSASGSEVGRLAILSEDETAFGRDTAGAAHGGAEGAPPPGGCIAGDGKDQPTYLYYPRDISALRSAYQRQSIFAHVGGASSSADTARRTLETDLSDPETAQHDTIRSYSGDQTALSQEAELQQITSMLRAHRIEYLLLRSSNPLDQLFLAHYFKLSYPEGRVVILGADLLLRRETGASGLNGIETLSTYPLLPWTPDWTGPGGVRVLHSHRVFTNDEAEGAYIAARLLLHQLAPPTATGAAAETGAETAAATAAVAGRTVASPQGPPRSRVIDSGFVPHFCRTDLDLRDYSLPFWAAEGDELQCGAPPTWLAVLGNGGYWPVAALAAPAGGWHHTPKGSIPRLLTSLRVTAGMLFRPWSPANTAGGDPHRWIDMPLSMKLCLTGIFVWACLHLSWCLRPSLTVKPGHRTYFTRPGGREHPRLILFGSTLVTAAAIVAAWGFGAMSVYGEPLPHAWLYRAFLPLVWALGALAVLANVWVEGYLPRLPRRLRRYVLRGSPLAWSRCGLPRRHRSRARCMRRLRREMAGRLLWYVGATLAVYLVVDFYLDNVLGAANRVPTYWRAMSVTSGDSPILPPLALCVGLYGWLWYGLQALALFGPHRPSLPLADELLLPAPAGHRDRLFAMLSEECAGRPLADWCAPFSRSIAQVAAGTLLIVLVVGFLLSSDLPIRSLGSTPFAVICCLAMAACLSVLLANAWQLLQVWLRLRHLLLFLDKLPLRRTLMALKGFSWGSVWRMSGNVLDLREKLMFRQFETLNHLSNALRESRAFRREERERWIFAIETTRVERQAYARWYSLNWDQWSARDRTRLHRVQRQLASIAAMLLTEMLIPSWRAESHSLVLDLSGPADAGSEAAAPAPSLAARLSEAMQSSEELVCLVYLGFIQNVLGRMRSLAMGMVWLFVAVALSVSSYPFDPRSLLSGAMIVLFITLGVVISVVYAQMHRDATLSYLTNTKPGELGSEFWYKLIGFGIGPALGLLASVFPEFTNFFFSWLQPGVASIK